MVARHAGPGAWQHKEEEVTAGSAAGLPEGFVGFEGGQPHQVLLRAKVPPTLPGSRQAGIKCAPNSLEFRTAPPGALSLCLDDILHFPEQGGGLILYSTNRI